MTRIRELEGPSENDQELEALERTHAEPLRQNSDWRELGRITENPRAFARSREKYRELGRTEYIF